MPAPAVSVLMPTYEQDAFLPRALASLFAQSLDDWEAIVIDDGASPATQAALLPWREDPRLRVIRHERNEGLGRALNAGLDAARAPVVAYLPSDDVLYREHLAQLCATLDAHPGAVLAYSHLRHHYNRSADGPIPGCWLQLVQCAHRLCSARWVERDELETDDLERLFWSRLRSLGPFAATAQLSCEWVDHPLQRHKLMQEPLGGINPFRQHYRVGVPLRFHTSVGNAIDEAAQYAGLRPNLPAAAAEPAQSAPRGLRILLVGELAYNAERVLALEAQGQRLYGLWMRRPYWFNTVGPLPFGQVEEVPFDDWRDAVRRIAPDLIYGLLNWQAVPFVHEVMEATPGIPFVWHFKEGPFICIEKGCWPELLALYRRADGRIFSSPEMRDWFDSIIPGLSASRPCCVLDGDLPLARYMEGPSTPRLSSSDGAIHTVVPGRPIGLHPPQVAELAQEDVHLHFYGDYTHGQWRDWIGASRALAPRHLHLHPHVGQDGWRAEFSRYDAGWLHAFDSANGGEIRRANWDDLNYPARLATLAAGGLPMIQRDNAGAIVATQTLARELGIGVFYRSTGELAQRLRDRPALDAMRARVEAERARFSFDAHVPALLAFFRQAMAREGAGSRAPG